MSAGILHPRVVELIKRRKKVERAVADRQAGVGARDKAMQVNGLLIGPRHLIVAAEDDAGPQALHSRGTAWRCAEANLSIARRAHAISA